MRESILYLWYVYFSLFQFPVTMTLVLSNQTVTSSNESLKKRVETVLDMAVTTVSSLTESFSSGVPITGEDVVLSKEMSTFGDALIDTLVQNPTEGDVVVEPTGEVEKMEVSKEVEKGTVDVVQTKIAGPGRGEEDSEGSDFDVVLEVHD